MGELFHLENIPINFLSYGRSYKDGNFQNTIGDFHDYIPMLFDLGQEVGPFASMEKIIDFRNYIKENNLNFINFVVKNSQRWGKSTRFLSPFIFSSLVGLYDHFKENSLNDLLLESQLERISDKIFSMEISKDHNTDRLWINYQHNSLFQKDTIKEAFLRTFQGYSEKLNIYKKNQGGLNDEKGN